MLKALLRVLAMMPLPIINAVGVLTGWGLYFFSHKVLRRTRKNLSVAGITSSTEEYHRLVRHSILETGKGLVETFAIWFRPQGKVLPWVRECHGWEHVEAAQAQGQGIIFLTPHLGCYEVTALYYAARHPITVLYRPARQQWLAPLIDEGRNRSQIKQAPTSLSGVRSLLKALKQGEAVGILPDQVPEFGEGTWADFFGTPAYTMTLVGKLADTSGARVLLAFGERLPWGRGYIIHIQPLEMEPTPANINQGIEQLIRQCPAQYLWSYRRFKQPKPHGKPRETQGGTN
ncbi:lysophospholipid acyltransferase family protein [Methylobacillus flagellatus]|uniref:Lipid A biosynthesis acyltransferase n=1 Tax=Methylobacillus flagellatus (strain ATCC 51484 / DSM 6875 / VKM B-1610 / KT) TaxID=265072 RepID=Q1H4X1_METFK|nr:lysophospholipid acyltransferase family protein [Methylobacillus flagellatus]ABE48466.1 lipid A biosynthesis acyltransferase [Methylobacillus flagellatus KT]